MPTRLNLQKSLKTQSGDDIRAAMRGSLYDLQAQTRKPSQRGILKGQSPTGQGEGDQTTRLLDGGGFLFSVYDQEGNPAELALAADSSTNLAFKTGVVAPVVADYPNPGDNGQFYDTVLSQLYIVRNYGGALIFPNFVSISGTISAAQHGDLSGAGGTMHNLNQLNGELSDTQHGDRGRITGGNPMHTGATTTEAGFMSAADKVILDAATSAATANAIVKRNGTGGANFAGTLTTAAIDATTIDASGVIDTASHYEVDGVQVVKEQQAAITGADGTLGDATTKINLVIGTLRQHGLIATAWAIFLGVWT